jgi:hypothetical protein
MGEDDEEEDTDDKGDAAAPPAAAPPPLAPPAVIPLCPSAAVRGSEPDLHRPSRDQRPRLDRDIPVQHVESWPLNLR